MLLRSFCRALSLVAVGLLTTAAVAQVHYHDDGRPWGNRARRGPDAEVDGWYYNLGITGLRVQLDAQRPKHLLVKHVFDGTPAARGKIEVGDWLLGVGGRPFREEHQNGYGEKVFGAQGPIGEFGVALEAAQGEAGKGRLEVVVEHDGERREVTLRVGQRYGAFGQSFPADCKKSARIRSELLDWLVEQQRDDGSWGNPVHDTFAPLALLGSGEQKYRKAVERNVRFHARRTRASGDETWLVNWSYCAAGLVMGEWYLATGDKKVLPELQEVHDFLMWSQYTDVDQINPKARETHPHAVPDDDRRKMGGWGHNPGFEGYGPICMLTGQAAAALALMKHSGIEVDRDRLDMAYDFLARGTGPNGYVWYADEVGRSDGWADPGRTGAAGVANLLSPYREPVYQERALAHARLLGEHPESFPDTHGSPPMGMAWAAAAAARDPRSFRRLMDGNRWWFALAQCADGTFYYQPNRDNAGYGNDARLYASAITAFILTIPEHGLHLTGKPLPR